MKQKVFLIPLLLSLISASSSNFIYVKSKIRHEDNTETYYAKVTADSSKLFSGPCTNGTDDSKPFNFAFYGCFAVESSKVPDSIAIELKMDTFHGSHTALDKFESSAYDSFVIQLS